MNLGNQIASYRKGLNITQEALAQKLGVTNQAVSKWESNQCCPDVQLLPKLADVFGISLDELFGRHGSPVSTQLPWEDDDTLRVVLYIGHTLAEWCTAEDDELAFAYAGKALNIESAVSVVCNNVYGSIKAGGEVTCLDVQGDVQSDADVFCGKVGGQVTAGGTVTIEEE